MKKKNSLPVYMKIAIDMAGKISRNEIKVDTKISGRSTLAGEYNVSPETIRKAMALLSDMAIVEVKHGKGIYVASQNQAETFIERYKTKESISELKQKVREINKERQKLDEELMDTMNTIIEYSVRFKNNEHIPIYEQLVPECSWAIGKSVKDLLIWQNTGATVIGFKRNNSIQISPGPYEILEAGDELLFVGDINSAYRLNQFLVDEI